MFPNPNCFKLRALAKEFTKTVADMTKDQCKSLAQKLKNYVQDVSLYSHPSANGILDTLVSAKVHKFHLPSDIDDDTLFELEKVVVKEWFYGATVSNEVRRLALGRLMGEIQDRMVRKQEGKDAKDEERLKLAVYSGHDTTIAPLLIILNAFDERLLLLHLKLTNLLIYV
ncbi:phosphoglycerate mutase-like protein [Rhizopus microsporus]|uniref:Phosphoglycerate mutase-like protein n=1 Tax=Rhizopus microsporus TaxID=58291 RepID=A0A1X0RVF8_RHIZD|nr:phosphoglycerate mutase-like protein [Rhizopus microsporus]